MFDGRILWSTLFLILTGCHKQKTMDSMLTLEKLKEKAQLSRIAATNLRTLDIFDCFKLFRTYYNAGKSTKYFHVLLNIYTY